MIDVGLDDCTKRVERETGSGETVVR